MVSRAANLLCNKVEVCQKAVIQQRGSGVKCNRSMAKAPKLTYCPLSATQRVQRGEEPEPKRQFVLPIRRTKLLGTRLAGIEKANLPALSVLMDQEGDPEVVGASCRRMTDAR